MNFRALALTSTRRAFTNPGSGVKIIDRRKTKPRRGSFRKRTSMSAVSRPRLLRPLCADKGRLGRRSRAHSRAPRTSPRSEATRGPRADSAETHNPSTRYGSIGRSRRILLGAHLIDGLRREDRTRWIPWYASSPSPARAPRFTDTVVSHVRLDRAEYRGQTGRTRPLVPRIALAASLGFLAGERERAATPRATRAVRRARAPDARQTRGARSRPRRDAVEKRTRARVPTRDPAGV